MKVDQELEVNSRPALLRALFFSNAPDNLGIPIHTFFLRVDSDLEVGSRPAL